MVYTLQRFVRREFSFIPVSSKSALPSTLLSSCFAPCSSSKSVETGELWSAVGAEVAMSSDILVDRSQNAFEQAVCTERKMKI
jgi:hypothetical protein